MTAMKQQQTVKAELERNREKRRKGSTRHIPISHVSLYSDRADRFHNPLQLAAGGHRSLTQCH